TGASARSPSTAASETCHRSTASSASATAPRPRRCATRTYWPPSIRPCGKPSTRSVEGRREASGRAARRSRERLQLRVTNVLNARPPPRPPPPGPRARPPPPRRAGGFLRGRARRAGRGGGCGGLPPRSPRGGRVALGKRFANTGVTFLVELVPPHREPADEDA